MGCNSHTYIEYRRKDNPKGKWMTLHDDDFDHRNYNLYAKMGNVRNYGGIQPIAPLRGIPDDVGYCVYGNYYNYIIDDNLADKGFPHYVKAEKAAEWVAEGWATLSPKDSRRISSTDWHSPSWLTAAEFCAAVAEVAADDIYWTAIAALVDHVAKQEEYECRVVFWFDN